MALSEIGNFLVSPTGLALMGAAAGGLYGSTQGEAGKGALYGGLLGYGAGSALGTGTGTASTALDTAGASALPSLGSQGVSTLGATTAAAPSTMEGLLGLAGQGAELYGNVESGLAQRDLSQEQINLLRTQNALAQANYNRQVGRETGTEQAIGNAFSGSNLRNYYSV